MGNRSSRLRNLIAAGAFAFLVAGAINSASAVELCFVNTDGATITGASDVSAMSCPAGTVDIAPGIDTYFDLLFDFDDTGSDDAAGFQVKLDFSGSGLENGLIECVGPTDDSIKAQGGDADAFDFLSSSASCTDPGAFGSSSPKCYPKSGTVIGPAAFGNLTGKTLAPGRKYILSRCHVLPPSSESAGNKLNYVEFVTGSEPNGTVVKTGSAQAIVGDGNGTLSDVTIDVVTPPCTTAVPTNVSVTSSPVAGCTATTGDAVLTVKWTNPSKCYESDGVTPTSPDCTGKAVDIVRSSSTISSADSSGTYSETITGAITNGTAITYSLTGVSTQCSDSAAVTASVTPKCGEPPTVAVVAPKAALQGVALSFPITISEIDVDSDMTDITVTLWYWTCAAYKESGVCTPTSDNRVNNVADSPDSSGKLSLKIPGEAIVAGQPVYYAIVAQDDRVGGLKDENSIFPSTFDPDTDPEGSLGACTETGDGCINGDDVLAGTKLDFLTQPTPDRYPFQPTGNDYMTLDFQINEQAVVTARIYSLDGRLRRVLSDSGGSFDVNTCDYNQGCKWDGSDFKGSGADNLVANGTYIVHIQALGTGAAFKDQVLETTGGVVVMK